MLSIEQEEALAAVIAFHINSHSVGTIQGPLASLSKLELLTRRLHHVEPARDPGQELLGSRKAFRRVLEKTLGLSACLGSDAAEAFQAGINPATTQTTPWIFVGVRFIPTHPHWGQAMNSQTGSQRPCFCPLLSDPEQKLLK
jgi:hypothetical protein